MRPAAVAVGNVDRNNHRVYIKYNGDSVGCVKNPVFMEIWYGDIGNADGSVQRGKRPLLIVSNDKNNKHSNTVNVMPLTTKMNKRNLPCHVEIVDYERYGLNAPSTIMVEQIMTMPKDKLLYRCGKITDRKTLQSIYDAMMVQFPLLGNASNHNN